VFYAILADVVVALHLVYLAVAIGGQLLILVGILARWQWIRNPYFRVIHLAMIVFVAFEALIGMQCPLTTWESDLRALAGQNTDRDMTFIGRLLGSIVFLDVPQEYLTAGYYGFAAVVVFCFIVAPPRWRKARADESGDPKPNFAEQRSAH
jgi:hypothetical protein